jgi:hypothetical protein
MSEDLGPFWQNKKPVFRNAADELERRKVPAQRIMDEIVDTKTKVENILMSNERARGDYQYLCWLFAMQYGGMKVLPYEEFQKLMSLNFATVERCCRLIQHDERRPLENRYLPTDEKTLRLRKIREKTIRLLIHEVP